MFRQYRAALMESKQSIKVAGAAGIQTELSQMEGGEMDEFKNMLMPEIASLI